MKISLVLRYSLKQLMSTISVMTFSRHTAFLPIFREELEFDFSVDTLEHSDKSDSGLILSCSNDRTPDRLLRPLNPSFNSGTTLDSNVELQSC